MTPELLPDEDKPPLDELEELLTPLELEELPLLEEELETPPEELAAPPDDELPPDDDDEEDDEDDDDELPLPLLPPPPPLLLGGALTVGKQYVVQSSVATNRHWMHFGIW